jgi:hypothetical protein
LARQTQRPVLRERLRPHLSEDWTSERCQRQFGLGWGPSASAKKEDHMRIALIACVASVALSGTTASPRAAAPLAPDGKTAALPGKAPRLLESLPGEGLRDVRVLRYTMDGRIRPLLFWFGRDDIGFARVVWREGELGARGYELLVGTDPAKAPRALNRWGYIAEEAAGADGALLALMTGSDEGSYDEATANASHPATGGDFRAIRSELRGTTSTWQTARVETPAAFTVHDVDAALERVRHETAAAARREDTAPAGSRSGFLVALAELIDHGAGGVTKRDSKSSREPVRYVFGQNAYELRLRETQTGTLLIAGQPTPIVRSSFEIRTVTTDARTRFDVSFGAAGRLLSVPVGAEWQPRWWLKIELRLETAVAPG